MRLPSNKPKIVLQILSSSPLLALGMRSLSNKPKMVLQILSSSPSTLPQYSFAKVALPSLPFVFSFCSTLVMMRHAARRLPTAFLNRELIASLADRLHVASHLIVAFGLLCKLGKVDIFFALRHRKEAVTPKGKF